MIAGIIGGTGKMGRLFGSVLERHGFEVLASGRSTTLTNRKLAEESDLVMVSVPIRSTVGVIGEVAPLLTGDQLLCDLTSLKGEPVKAMLSSKAQVLGTHPLFGPTVSSLRNQTIILTPARCGGALSLRLPEILRNEGANLVVMTPEAHDRLMAVIQGLTHFGNLCMADAIRRTGTESRRGSGGDLPGLPDPDGAHRAAPLPGPGPLRRHAPDEPVCTRSALRL